MPVIEGKKIPMSKAEIALTKKMQVRHTDSVLQEYKACVNYIDDLIEYRMLTMSQAEIQTHIKERLDMLTKSLWEIQEETSNVKQC